MANQVIFDRLVGIQAILNGVHKAGAPMSSASKGSERQAFIDQFLKEVLPPIYRFGSGDATDAAGNRSGQLDVVVEYPFAPNLPLGAASSRLYIAEGIAAVIEVKSDVAGQWDDALKTARALAPLQRKIDAHFAVSGGPPPNQIPFFVAGYVGWKQMETLEQHLADAPNIAGILVIDPGFFISRGEFQGIKASGAWALWGLISCLYRSISFLQVARSDPLLYAL